MKFVFYDELREIRIVMPLKKNFNLSSTAIIVHIIGNKFCLFIVKALSELQLLKNL